MILNTFDQNAKSYSEWDVTKNKNYLKQFYDFSEIDINDKVIDIACGSGDFLLNAAPLLGESKGIDLSAELIKIARERQRETKAENIKFEEGNIEEQTNDSQGKFDVVVCRMAFHHFNNQNRAFSNCLRYGKPVCKVAMQDIITHENLVVDAYFDELERCIDCTHKQIISKKEFERLFEEHGIEIDKSIVLEREVVLEQYISHAIQSLEDKNYIDQLVERGMKNPIISKYIYEKENQIIFKRRVLLIMGRRK